MADITLGRDVQSFSKTDAYAPISRVTITDDAGNDFTAGNDTGRALELGCPWATQTMANDLLTKFRGKVYRPFTASGAMLDPAAELGDTVSCNGVESILGEIDTTYDALCASDISAPGDQDVNHEYEYSDATTRELKRKLTLGANYYGTTITRQNGLEIVKTNGETTKSRVKLNSDVLAFYDDDGNEALYFDTAEGTYKFAGVLNVSDLFQVDKDGTVSIKQGSIQIGGTAAAPVFKVDANGKLTATSADLAGVLRSAQLFFGPNNIEGSIGYAKGNDGKEDTDCLEMSSNFGLILSAAKGMRIAPAAGLWIQLPPESVYFGSPGAWTALSVIASGSGAMKTADYDSDGTVKSAGGIKAYVAAQITGAMEASY